MLPRFFEVRPELPSPRLADVPGAARAATRSLARALKPGDTVAITAGSRGISHIDTITGAVVAELQALGAQPFIVPAMGSHGGGTAEGQVELIA
ncbi:MAG: [Fe-S]-binding protein, partial [Candidatus Rokubacteria bacterium]|nr:[Fe-S]-binding protein [Candidatus Rokubacteria bacterium]